MVFRKTREATSVVILCLLGLVVRPGSAWIVRTYPATRKETHSLKRRSPLWEARSCVSSRSQLRFVDLSVENNPWRTLRTVHSDATQLQQAAAENTEEDDSVGGTSDSKGWWARIKAYFLQSKKDDDLSFKQRLAKMGFATVLSYGMISNLSYAVLISFAWYAFSVQVRENYNGRSFRISNHCCSLCFKMF